MVNPSEKGFHRAGRVPFHQRHDRARIHAAAEERAHRHIGHHAPPHRVVEQRPHAPGEFLFAQRLARRQLRLVADIPVLRDADAAVLREQVVAGQQLRDVAIHRVRRDRVAEGQEVRHPALADLPRHRRVGHDRLDLGGKDEPRAVVIVIERLLADPVARDKQARARRVPDRDGKHAVEPLQAVRAPFLIGVQNDLGVAARAEDMPFRLQLRPEIAEVVQLAVEDDAARPVFVPNRLLPARKVDDAQPPHPEEDRAAAPHPALVRPAVPQPVGRDLRLRFIHLHLSELSVYSTHSF